MNEIDRLLAEAEARFGPRDPRFTLVGVEYADDGPCIWFPRRYRGREILIILSTEAEFEPDRREFQLRHEAIHLLSPARSAINAEEGLAVSFSEQSGFCRTRTKSYAAARDLAEEMLAADADIVRRVRRDEPSFERWTPNLLTAFGVDPRLAEKLCGRFVQ
jgi:hypothetical protein